MIFRKHKLTALFCSAALMLVTTSARNETTQAKEIVQNQSGSKQDREPEIYWGQLSAAYFTIFTVFPDETVQSVHCGVSLDQNGKVVRNPEFDRTERTGDVGPYGVSVMSVHGKALIRMGDPAYPARHFIQVEGQTKAHTCLEKQDTSVFYRCEKTPNVMKTEHPRKILDKVTDACDHHFKMIVGELDTKDMEPKYGPKTQAVRAALGSRYQNVVRGKWPRFWKIHP